MRQGDRFIFWGYADATGRRDPIFNPGDFGVVVEVDGDAVRCLLTDQAGRVAWWRSDILFAEELVLLTYAPRIGRERLPIPFGTMIGEPR